MNAIPFGLGLTVIARGAARAAPSTAAVAWLVVMGALMAPPVAAQPMTIDEAIAQVRAIDAPDANERARLRAREAMELVGERVTVINDATSVCYIYWVGGDEAEMEQAVERARTDPSVDNAETAWDVGGGRCDEHANLMVRILRGAGERAIALQTTAQNGHVFPLVNYDPSYDPDNPWTWGEHAFVADTWLENAFWHAGFVDDPEDAWDHEWLFDDGEAFVSAGAEFTTRQSVAAFSGRGRAWVEARCPKFRPVRDAYLRYPAEVREDMGYDIPMGACGNATPVTAPSRPARPAAREGFVSCPVPPSGFELRASSSWGEPDLQPGEVHHQGGMDDSYWARCTYGARGDERTAFSVRLEWKALPAEFGRDRYCRRASGEPLVNSSGTWSLSFGSETTDEWRGPYRDRMSLGVSFSLIYSSHQRTAWVGMSEHREDVFQRVATGDWRRAAATHLLQQSATHAWRCP